MDLVQEDELGTIVESVQRETRPAVQMIRASNGAVDPVALLGLGAAAEDDLDSRKSHIDDHGEHDHDDFTSSQRRVVNAARSRCLDTLLKNVIAEHGILRIKGFAHVAGKDMRLLIQGVGDRIQHYFDRDWGADEERRTRLVVIGETGLDEQADPSFALTAQ